MFRRFRELGPRTSDVQRRQFRTLVGLEGDFGDGWSYDAYYQYGNNSQDQTNGGVFNALNFWQALQTEDDGSGGHQCADAVARSLGCVPINVFGRGSITGAALDWVSTDSQLTTRMTQHVAAASVSGSLFELPAGPLDVAMGVEWREEKSKYNSDSLAATGLTSGNSIPNTVGSYNVEELFAEAIVPIATSGIGEYLGLELAARYANYSTIGSNGAYKVGLDWRPMEGLMIRGGWSRAVRAPNINELFNPGSETFRSFVDPCALGGKGGLSGDGVTTYVAQSAQVQANCATYGAGIQTLDPFHLNIRSAGGFASGNLDLKSEEATTYTIGAVYSPSEIPGLNMTVDYFDIKIEGAISSFGAQTTVDQCVRQPVFPDNPFCSLIQRQAGTGLVLRIDAQAINAAILHTKGVDFSLDYSTDLGEGLINFNMNGTYADENVFTPFIGGDEVSVIGSIGAPKWKANATVTYDINSWRVGWSTRFIDNVVPDPESPDAFGGSVGSFFYNDIQARYSFGDSGQYELFAGVDNVFDKEPPFLGQGRPGDVTGTNTAADVYDAIRRYVYAGFRAKF